MIDTKQNKMSKMEKLHEQKEKLSWRSFAIATIVTRDIFGYLFCGFVFILFLFTIFKNISEDVGITLQIIPSEPWILISIAIAIAYPTGRLIFTIGSFTWYVFTFGKWDNIYPKIFNEYKSYLALNRLKLFGIRLTKKNVRTLVGRLSAQWIFLKQPDLYFLSVTRANTLRILGETTFGLVLSIGVIMLIRFIIEENTEVILIATIVWLLVAGLSLAMSYKLRKQQVRRELSSIYIMLPKVPPIIFDQPITKKKQ